jgi:hypothetical protein
MGDPTENLRRIRAAGVATTTGVGAVDAATGAAAVVVVVVVIVGTGTGTGAAGAVGSATSIFKATSTVVAVNGAMGRRVVESSGASSGALTNSITLWLLPRVKGAFFFGGGGDLFLLLSLTVLLIALDDDGAGT